MVNAFVIKKYAGLAMAALVPMISYSITLLYFPFSIAISVSMFMALMMSIVANKLLDNPFRGMIEGKGLLVFNIDSTGIVRPFLASLDQPYIKGKLFGKKVTDVYDQQAVYRLSTPGVAKAELNENDKELKFILDEESFNKSRFGMFHYPVLIYNNQIKSLITKDFLGDQELKIFSDHQILNLNRKTEELGSYLRDFGRYIVESLKPASNLLSSIWPYILLGGVVIVLLVLFGPQIMAAIQGGAAPVAQAAGAATDSVGSIVQR